MYISVEYRKPLFISCLLFIFSFLFQLLKLYSTTTNYFDFGLYQNVIFNINYYPENHKTIHFQPILYCVAALFKILEVETYSLALIILKSIFLSVLSYQVFLIGGMIGLFIYILSPVLWMYIYFSYDFDIFAAILLSFYYISLKKDKLSIAVIMAVAMIFVKEIFIIPAFGMLFYLYFRNLKCVKVIAFIYILFYTLILICLDRIGLLSDYMGYKISDFNNGYFYVIKYIIILYFPVLFLGILSSSSLFITWPIFIILIFSDNQFHNIPSAHYSIFFIPQIIYSYINKIDKLKIKKLYIFIIAPLFYFITISRFPLSLQSLLTKDSSISSIELVNNVRSNFNAYKELNKIFTASDNISVQANIFVPSLANRKYYKPIPIGVNDEVANIIIINRNTTPTILDYSCIKKDSSCIGEYNNMIVKISDYKKYEFIKVGSFEVYKLIKN